MTTSPFPLTETDDHSVTITVSGRVEATEARPLSDALGRAIRNGYTQVTADLRQAAAVDAASLAALVEAHVQLNGVGGRLVVLAPTSVDAARVFHLTRFDHDFLFVADLQDDCLHLVDRCLSKPVPSAAPRAAVGRNNRTRPLSHAMPCLARFGQHG